MMRSHCDRCDALCDEYPTWVIEDGHTNGCKRAELTVGSHPCGCPSHVWHFVIHSGGPMPCEEKMFCRACRITILEAHIAALILSADDRTYRGPKCDGNHGGPRCADPECWNQ